MVENIGFKNILVHSIFEGAWEIMSMSKDYLFGRKKKGQGLGDWSSHEDEENEYIDEEQRYLESVNFLGALCNEEPRNYDKDIDDILYEEYKEQERAEED